MNFNTRIVETVQKNILRLENEIVAFVFFVNVLDALEHHHAYVERLGLFICRFFVFVFFFLTLIITKSKIEQQIKSERFEMK